jgi:hypothetical protein
MLLKVGRQERSLLTAYEIYESVDNFHKAYQFYNEQPVLTGNLGEGGPCTNMGVITQALTCQLKHRATRQPRLLYI